MKKPKAIVLSGDGINCEAETLFALELSGFDSDLTHISDLMADPAKLDEYQLAVIPGGFSYGDEIASGKVFAIKLKESLQDALYSYIAKGNLLLGICNGFQVLVQLGLLPNSQSGEARLVSLIRNSQGHFTNKWVKLRTTPSRENLFFNKLNEIELPIRHGEGRLALEISGESMDKAANLVKERAPLRYVDEVNGSFDKIAALSNAQGNVLGLMPHPEAFVRWTQNPNWTSRKLEMKIHSGTTDPQHMPHGLAILRNAALSLN